MINELSLSRRQVLLAGTTVSLALAMPAMASEKKISVTQKELHR